MQISKDETSKLSRLTEMEKLNAALDILQSANDNMSDMFAGITNVIENTKKDLLSLESQRNKLRSEKEKLEQESEQQKEEISGLNQNQEQLLEEYAHIKEELKKFTHAASGGDGVVSFNDMKNTLSIYRVLLSEIFQSQPHFLVLLLLHGESPEMTVESLKNSSGISGAMILRACYELSRVNLIDFDIETKKAKLIRRLFK